MFNQSLQNNMHQNFINEITFLLVKVEYCDVVSWASIFQNRTEELALGAYNISCVYRVRVNNACRLDRQSKISAFSMQPIGSN